MWQFSEEAQGRTLVGGRWREADSAASFSVLNPATNAEIARVPNMGDAETRAAIAAAKESFESWSAMPVEDRADILQKWAGLIRDNAVELGELMTAEQGKPVVEAMGEFVAAAGYIDWAAQQAVTAPREEVRDGISQESTIHIVHEPVGVVGAITPWNFPAAMVARKLGPALAAGCPVVLKPAEDTPLTALALADLAVQAGVPAGVLNVVTGDRTHAPEIGAALMESPEVRKITFTGSTEVGKEIVRQSADTMKRVAMELGGNAPFVVLPSADMDLAIKGVLTSKFMNAGQMCISPNRIYVHDSIYDSFAEKLAEEAARITVGPGDAPDTQMGPLINASAAAKAQRHVDDAVAKGAHVLTGGHATEAGPQFFLPTVLTEMKPDMAIKSEETFGPIAALFRFREEAEVITQANDTRAGLAAYVFGAENDAQTQRVASRMQSGMVCINESLLIDEAIPFGGVKESGLGRENGPEGVREYQETRTFITHKSAPAF